MRSMDIKLSLREKLGVKILKRHFIDHRWTSHGQGSHLGTLEVKIDEKWYRIASIVAGTDAQHLFTKWAHSRKSK